MSLADLTSREAVLAAMAEFDEIGREAFLAKYGFEPSRAYFVSHEGHRYDSKPLAAAAFGYQFADEGPLPNEFSGGVSATKPMTNAHPRICKIQHHPTTWDHSAFLCKGVRDGSGRLPA